MNLPQTATEPVPLVLDIDGSLARTDLATESFWAALRTDTRATLAAFFTPPLNRAGLKHRLARISRLEAELLPLRDEVLDLMHAALRAERPVVLTSGADQSQVNALAQHLGLPAPHFGSNGLDDLTGEAKAALLVERFGTGGFDYVGNSTADLPVWREAQQVIAVAPPQSLATRIAALGKPVQTMGEPWRLASLWHEMRPQQWVKNLLLLLPFVFHALSLAELAPVLISIVAFCLLTSSVYLVNDMLDLGADRQHPDKRLRPIASGTLPITVASVSAGVLVLAALLIGGLVGRGVVSVELVYLIAGYTYSLWLKHVPWADLVLLAAFYVLRVIAGALAAGTGFSHWLVAFTATVFLALAAVKRLTDLARIRLRGNLPGRGYGHDDIPKLTAVAVAASGAAITVFLAYSLSPMANALYRYPWSLRLSALAIIAWFARMILLARVGKEDYDTVAFILRDRIGLVIAVIALALMILAK